MDATIRGRGGRTSSRFVRESDGLPTAAKSLVQDDGLLDLHQLAQGDLVLGNKQHPLGAQNIQEVGQAGGEQALRTLGCRFAVGGRGP